MATPQAKYVQEGDSVDYTAGSALSAGAVLETNGKAGILQSALASGEVGSLRIKGIIDAQKDASNITAGLMVGWDNDGTTVAGATGGALTATVASMDFVVGIAQEAAGTAVEDCKVLLNAPINGDLLTDNSGGTASTTLAVIAGTYDQGEIADVVASLAAAIEKCAVANI